MNKIDDKIKEVINSFHQSLSDIDNFVFVTGLSYSFFQDRYLNALPDSDEKVDIKILKEKLNAKIPNYESEVYVLAIINLIARTEALLNDILETLFIWKKKALIADKSISYKEVLESESIEELVKTIRAKEILEFSHASFKEKLKFLNDKFNLKFPDIEKNMTDIVELFTTRNIILHNNGFINETYLRINKGSNTELGSKRIIDKDYVHNAYIILTIIGKSIEKEILEKIKNKNRPT